MQNTKTIEQYELDKKNIEQEIENTNKNLIILGEQLKQQEEELKKYLNEHHGNDDLTQLSDIKLKFETDLATALSNLENIGDQNANI
jgi:cupin superfamily acireductone dioxygenase involved in methionine salvage